MPPAPSDLELIDRARRGDREAFRMLYERYARRVFAFLLGYTDEVALAEDLTQEVFLRVWKHLPRYREQGQFTAWVFRIARRLATDAHRRRRGEVPLSAVESPPLALHTAVDPEAQLLHQEALVALQQALHHLNPEHRAVLTLRFLVGLNVRETAAVLQRSEGAVRVLQHRALRALRRMLRDDGIGER